MNKLLAALLLILAVAQTQAVAANFSVSGGYLIDPTGAKFIPEGTNIDEYNMADILQDGTGYPVTTMLPKLNYIRVMVHPISFNATRPTSATYPNPANYQAMASLCQSAKIVCEFEDHGLTTPLINTPRHYTRPRVRENNGCWSSSRVNASISGCSQRSGIVGIRS